MGHFSQDLGNCHSYLQDNALLIFELKSAYNMLFRGCFVWSFCIFIYYSQSNMTAKKQRSKIDLGSHSFLKSFKRYSSSSNVKGSTDYSKSDNEVSTKWYVSFVIHFLVISNDFLRLDGKISLEFFNIA